MNEKPRHKIVIELFKFGNPYQKVILFEYGGR